MTFIQRPKQNRSLSRAGSWLCMCLLCGGSAAAETLIVRVVAIADGDTITVLDTSMEQHKIRLGGIDAPEKGQAFGNVSRQNLAGLAFGKQGEADCYKIDRYGRLVCTVYVDGKDVGLAQLDAGLAWWYRQYANEQPPQQRLEYEMAETKAAVDRIGLWSDPNPIPPWEWRKAEREREIRALVLPYQ